MVTRQMIEELLSRIDEKGEDHFLQQIYWLVKLHIERRAK